ncbi:hypothetical protein SBOR_0729 [Sclerotinia borealis F-4128]|uniref:Uncharacterized protein n=1 Tax=Sclerotinia borealis (strain F-4128) TaxID=1432307 RepID=W9CSQ7_SCLBF|nr:hypothetical protein SBOR_0729 [Sclerotinia borealis F-4128]
MAPMKDTTITPSRISIPRVAKNKPKESPEPIPKTTPKTIKKAPGRPKKPVAAKIPTTKAIPARDGKGKGKETEMTTPEVLSNSPPSDEIIRQEATYQNPFSTESSRNNTAALLSQWEAINSPILNSPESEKRLVDRTPTSNMSSLAKSKHERAYSASQRGRHIAIPPPASKDRGEQTAQLFEANKQHRLDSLVEGKFPDPTYPRASISGGTEPSPGFSTAMGFKYSPGFGGPHGFNMSPKNKFGFNTTPNSSAVPGTEDPSLEQTQPANPIDRADQIISDADVDAVPSHRVDGNAFTVPDSGSPVNWQNLPTEWDNNFVDWNQNRFTGQNYVGYQPFQHGSFRYPPNTLSFANQAPPPILPHGSYLGPMYPQYHPHETLDYGTTGTWTGPAIATQVPGVPLFPTKVSDNSELMDIKESRMTRGKTIFVPGGRIVKTTTTVFTPTGEEKKKGKNVERAPEDKVGIVVVDKEGNVDVESGDWLAGFNRIEGWEVEALLSRNRRRWPNKNRNGVTKKVITKNHTLKKAAPSKKDSTAPKSTPKSPTTESNLDYISFDLPPLPKSTRSRATRISKSVPEPAKNATVSKANRVTGATQAKKTSVPSLKANSKAKTKASTLTTPSQPQAAARKTVKPTSTPASKVRSARSSSTKPSPTPAKTKAPKTKSSTKSSTKSATSKSTAATPTAATPTTAPAKTPAKKSALSSGSNPTASKARKPEKSAPKTGALETVNTRDLEEQVKIYLSLADKAAKNAGRLRGKGAERAAKDFEALMGFVEDGCKELERRGVDFRGE